MVKVVAMVTLRCSNGGSDNGGGVEGATIVAVVTRVLVKGIVVVQSCSDCDGDATV